MMNNKLEQLKKELEKVEERIWWLEMADVLRGEERNEWYAKLAERRKLKDEIHKLEREG